MATTPTPKASDGHFSMPNIISRFRSKRRTTSKKHEAQQQKDEVQDRRPPPLVSAPLALVLPQHQHTLSSLGWTTLTFPNNTSQAMSSQYPGQNTPNQNPNPNPNQNQNQNPGPHPLQTAYEDLLTASQAFFNLPASEKAQWKHRLGSEEGWSSIRGEKEFITLRTLAYCPEMLGEPAKRYWDMVGVHCSSTLGRVSTWLGLPDGENEGLRRFVGPCVQMPEHEEGKTATMLRLFRYEGGEEKVVAEAHADLGLVSVVVGDMAGLEVWDGSGWFDVEREVESRGEKGATLLVGRQLERLANGRVPAGGHRVVSYSRPVSSLTSLPKEAEGEAQDKAYRHSIVFVLRGHEPTLIDSEALETHITGKWAVPMKGVTTGAFYERIRGQHFNINVGLKERDDQKRKLHETNDK